MLIIYEQIIGYKTWKIKIYWDKKDRNKKIMGKMTKKKENNRKITEKMMEKLWKKSYSILTGSNYIVIEILIAKGYIGFKKWY